MLLEQIKAEGLAHYSYLVGDEGAGVCAVIDPRRDVEVYLERAQRAGVRIIAILETHIHADFVSGSRELAARTGAPIYVGAEGEVRFEHRPLHDGDRIELGKLHLDVLHVPGHTPEHVAFVISGGQGAAEPWGVFTGDTLFAGEVGRPDLLGAGTEEGLARALYRSLHEKLLPLGDDVIIYPAHGEGSPCGASIGERKTSTIGYERRNNPLFQARDEARFAAELLEAQSPAPAYYPRMKRINAEGPRVLGALPALEPLDAADVARMGDDPGTVLLDLREIEAFGGAHIPGSINIALRDAFPIWVGRMLDPDARLLLIAAHEGQLEAARTHLLRIGYERIAGYLRGGIRGWTEQGRPFDSLPLLGVAALRERIEAGGDLQVLDVRSHQEWAEGHIPTARHIYLADLPGQLDRLDRERPVAVYCGSGYRASLAASLLKRGGFRHVYNVPGSMAAWKAAGYPLEGSTEGAPVAALEW